MTAFFKKHSSIRILSGILLGIGTSLSISCGDPALQSQTSAPEPEELVKQKERLQDSQQSTAAKPSVHGLRHSTSDDGHVAPTASLAGESPSHSAKDIADCKDNDYASSMGKTVSSCKSE